MAYTSVNPRFNTTIFTDVGAGVVTTPPVGANTLLNRLGQLYLKDSSGTEVSFGSSVATPTVTGTVTTFVPTIASAIKVVSSANYVFTATDGFSAALVTTGASNRTITLPAGSLSAGRIITIRKQDSGAGTVIISSASSETLDGYTLSGNGYFLTTQYAQVTLIGDGTNWELMSTCGDRITSGAISDTVVGSTTLVAVTGASIVVPPGGWQVYANGHLNLSQNGSGGVQLFAGGSFTGGAATVFNNIGADNPTSPFSFRVPARITSATTYTLQIFAAGNTTTFQTSAQSITGDRAAQFYAERVS